MVKSEYACPTCKATTGQSNQIFANAGELVCSKVPGHRWNDTKTFLDLNPTVEFEVVMPTTQQENRTPLTIPVPIGLKQKADELYGAKLAATITAILWQMIEGKAMIVPATDLERLAERLGTRFQNSSELVGLVYSKVCEANDAKLAEKNAVEDLKAYEKLSPGRVVLDIEKHIETVREKARDAGMPIKLWLDTQFANAIENGWF